jgi:predicted small lipoprotein YifL/predicted DNA-binding ribbon-helix-helix protein
MKKLLLLVLVSAMVLSLALAGCGNKTTEETPAQSASEAPSTSAAVQPSAETSATESATTGAAVKTGLGSVISIAKSTSATADAAALAEADIVSAAVTVDANGKILNVKIDMTQSKVNFDAKGQLTTDVASEVKTKVELGDEYGMKSASGIGKEWYEQIAALEDWMVGKTIDEVMALSMTSEGTTDDPDLTSSVTIHVGDYLKAVQKAVANAKDFGVAVTGATKTGLGNVNSIAKSTGATADAAGVAQTDDVMFAVTLDESGKIVGAVIDTAQVQIAVDATGAVTSDLSAELKSKVELGDAYGMKSASGIGKEWYEQAAALAQWMIGKTVDEVAAIKVSDEGTTTEADLTSSVTIHVGDYIKALQKAAANAD